MLTRTKPKTEPAALPTTLDDSALTAAREKLAELETKLSDTKARIGELHEQLVDGIAVQLAKENIVARQGELDAADAALNEAARHFDRADQPARAALFAAREAATKKVETAQAALRGARATLEVERNRPVMDIGVMRILDPQRAVAIEGVRIELTGLQASVSPLSDAITHQRGIATEAERSARRAIAEPWRERQGVLIASLVQSVGAMLVDFDALTELNNAAARNAIPIQSINVPSLWEYVDLLRHWVKNGGRIS